MSAGPHFARALALVGAAGFGLACTDVRREFVCDDDAACVLDGEVGACEANARCSFDDADCPTGRRYGQDAGDGAGSCVAPWLLHVAGPFDETAPLVELDRTGRLHVLTSFADRVEVGDAGVESVGGTDALHLVASARTGRRMELEGFGSAGDDAPSGLRRWGEDAVVLATVFDGEASAWGAKVPRRGSLLARRGGSPWATAVPRETSETRALLVEALTVDGAGTIVSSGDAYGAPLVFDEAITLDVGPTGFAGFVASFTGEGVPKSAFPVAIEGGATEACNAVATDGDRRFAAACTGYFADDAGEVDFGAPYPLLVIGSTFDGYPYPFAALPPTTTITFVGFGLDGALVVGGFFQAETFLPDHLETRGEVRLVAAGEADAFVARIYVEIGDGEVFFGTASVTQLGGPDAGVFPFALEAGDDGTLHVAGAFYGEVAPFGPSAGGVDAFALSIGEGGVFTAAHRYGGALQDLASGLALDGEGRLYLAGTFQGDIEVNGTTLRSAGGTDVFVTPVAP